MERQVCQLRFVSTGAPHFTVPSVGLLHFASKGARLRNLYEYMEIQAARNFAELLDSPFHKYS